MKTPDSSPPRAPHMCTKCNRSTSGCDRVLYRVDGEVVASTHADCALGRQWNSDITVEMADPRHTQFGQAMWKFITDKGGDFCGEEISEDILPLAMAAGLCCRVAYDPELHGEGIEADPGDEIWWWGDPLPEESDPQEEVSGAVTESRMIDWLQEMAFASSYGIEIKQGVSDDGARQRTLELRTMVGSGPWQTLQSKHGLRAAIAAAMASEITYSRSEHNAPTAQP